LAAAAKHSIRHKRPLPSKSDADNNAISAKVFLVGVRLAGEAAEKLRFSILAWTLASTSEDA
jgi:hypothetical protein